MHKTHGEPDVASKLSFGAHENYVGHNLTELYNIYVSLLTVKSHSRVMSLNLTQWRTLQFIRYNPEQTQRVLSEAVGIDPSSMTPIIDLFERKKWVRRKKSKVNRSAHGIVMAPSGFKAYDKIHREIKNTEELIQSALGDYDAKKLNELLVKLKEGLAKNI